MRATRSRRALKGFLLNEEWRVSSRLEDRKTLQLAASLAAVTCVPQHNFCTTQLIYRASSTVEDDVGHTGQCVWSFEKGQQWIDQRSQRRGFRQSAGNGLVSDHHVDRPDVERSRSKLRSLSTLQSAIRQHLSSSSVVHSKPGPKQWRHRSSAIVDCAIGQHSIDYRSSTPLQSIGQRALHTFVGQFSIHGRGCARLSRLFLQNCFDRHQLGKTAVSLLLSGGENCDELLVTGSTNH